MSSETTWLVIGLCAVVTFAIKAAGPVAFGGRDLPDLLNRIVIRVAPALLAALVITQALADGGRLTAGADTVGVAAAGAVLLRGASILVGVGVAVGVTAGLRALGV